MASGIDRPRGHHWLSDFVRALVLPMGPPEVAGARRCRCAPAGRRRLAGQDYFDGPWIVAQGREGLERDRQQRPGRRAATRACLLS